MSDLIWLSEAQMRRIERHFPRSHGKHPSSHAGERRARDVDLRYDEGVRVQAAC